MESLNEQIEQELAYCKPAVSARVMATHEGSEDSNTTGGGEEVSPNTVNYRKGKVPYNGKDKGKDMQRESMPKLKCFICDDPHLAREFPKREALSALIEKSERGMRRRHT